MPMTNLSTSNHGSCAARHLARTDGDAASSAFDLSSAAIREWEKALKGTLALPAAVALSVASGAMIAAAVAERTFELIELSIGEVGRRVGSRRDDRDEHDARDERDAVRPD